MTKQVSNSEWQAFFDSERKFLNWIEDTFENVVVFSDDLKYKEFQLFENNEKVIWYKPPRYIRRIVRAKDESDYQQAFDWSQEVLNLYHRAMDAGKHTAKRLPVRFAQFLEPEVHQITYNTAPAYESIFVKQSSPIAVYRFRVSDVEQDNSMEWLERVKAVFPSARLQFDAIRLKGEVIIDSDELYQWSKADHIQRRLSTGKQYSGRLSYQDGSRRNTSLGFFIIGPEHHLDVYRTIPRKTRSDKLSKDKRIELPFPTDYVFYNL
ncbi:hypothetical protein [Vibrio mediterranei]|uniref:hypothetical protein n=1 Tax=Vibrio mediterranei TaxID=689 RepID=UPI004068DD3D